MQLNYYIYTVKDLFGHKEAVVVNEASDIVQFHMYDQNASKITFESEAYHLGDWCDQYGMKLKVIERTEDIESL